MARMEAHITFDDEDTKRVTTIHPASQESVVRVLRESEDSPDGRSNWVWVRLPNGDLILGVFPQGDTYFDVEKDATYPGDQNNG